MTTATQKVRGVDVVIVDGEFILGPYRHADGDKMGNFERDQARRTRSVERMERYVDWVNANRKEVA